MSARGVTNRITLAQVTEEQTLAKLLRLHRGDRSLRAMARLCDLPVMTIQRIEAGMIELPQRDTMRAISAGYRIPLEVLARVAYLGGTEPSSERSEFPLRIPAPPP